MTQTRHIDLNGCTASCDTADKGTEIGPFGRAAVELHHLGLAVVPCPFASDHGKSVEGAVKGHHKWQRRAPLAWVEKMATRWASSANIGILTELSGVTVVDVDGPPELVAAIIERCGDTPLKTRTPSGGVHLWYRCSGERSVNLRDTEGVPVDVKGRGASVIVVPPSVRPSGPHAGKTYEFIEGSWGDLRRLPKIRPGALPTGDTAPARRDGGVARLRNVERGRRNRTLLSLSLREARYCDDEATLLDRMQTIVADHFEDHPEDPFTDNEIRKTVARAWEYEVTERNWAGTEAKAYVTASEASMLAKHKHGRDGMMLLVKLRLVHWDRATFSASPKAMWQGQTIPGWGHQSYRNALAALTDTSILKVTHPGGRGTNDPRLFAFATPVIAKGTKAVPNITKHPSPRPAEAQDGATASWIPGNSEPLSASGGRR